MPNGIKTLAALREQLHIHPWDPIPQEAVEAFETAMELERLARKNKERLIDEWRMRLAKRNNVAKRGAEFPLEMPLFMDANRLKPARLSSTIAWVARFSPRPRSREATAFKLRSVGAQTGALSQLARPP